MKSSRGDVPDCGARSSRLERLTADFYVRAPARAAEVAGSVAESLLYVAEIARVHAAAKQVEILVHAPEDLIVEMESSRSSARWSTL